MRLLVANNIFDLPFLFGDKRKHDRLGSVSSSSSRPLRLRSQKFGGREWEREKAVVRAVGELPAYMTIKKRSAPQVFLRLSLLRVMQSVLFAA
jgi:hypothetical protein